ncbi:MAG TPA: PAS domain S-box protein [Candidatus Saccharimonadales bacterium]|nr:PAS domain S-box protein [Candidatus Saccharimonadales bacterium]
MPLDPIPKSSPASPDPAGGAAPQANPLLEALPGPAWIVDCSSFRVLQRNAAAAVLSSDPGFLALFSSGLDQGLIVRLRSSEPRVGFHALFRGELSSWAFSAALLPNPTQRLVLAQAAALFDVPTQLSFDELLDSAFEPIAILDAKHRFVQISRRFKLLFGYSIDELRGKTPEVLVPADRQNEFTESTEVLNKGGVYQRETKRVCKNGTLVDVLVGSQAIASGRFRGGFVAVYRDLTELNRNTRYRNLRLDATRTLATATSVEQAARELIPAIGVALDWEVVRLWSLEKDGFKCIHGHTAPGQFCGGDSKISDLRCTISAERVASDGQAVWLNDFQPLDPCTKNTDGRPAEGLLAALPILDSHKQVLGVLELLSCKTVRHEPGQRELLEGICAHLGEFITRCKAEAALAENEAKFRTLTEMAPTAILIHDGGVAVYANASFEALTGFSRNEVLNRSVWALFHPEDRDILQERAKRRQRGEHLERRWQSRVVRKDGEVRWIDYSAARITLDNRPAVLCALSDVTEQRALEFQLRQNQKMEAVGRLAGGIAHDFNNLLMVIGCCSELILLDDDLSESVRRGTKEISNAADRAAALTRQLLAFSRHQVLEPRILDLNSTLTGTELILRRALGDDIELRFSLEAGLGLILADPSQIEQVAMNLAVNARDAMPNGGELSISTYSVNLDDSVSQAGDYAVLAVKDNGVGMNQEIQQHIFEPFFTTKSVNKGTGLGLSTVYGIAKQCGGFVTADSQPDCGATFKVYFPIAAGFTAMPEARQPLDFTATRSATILLVEDQDDVRAVLHASLLRDGYMVMQASSGAQALEVNAAFAGKIDLLLTDVVMAGMSGRDLADHLVSLRPGLKVLYVSGYNEDTVLQKGVVEGLTEFLQKPFPPSALSHKVRQILSR